jgi:hypothetical protein
MDESGKEKLQSIGEIFGQARRKIERPVFTLLK